MIIKFIPEAILALEPKIEVEFNQRNTATRIKYPEPDPKDRVLEEYYNDDHFE